MPPVARPGRFLERELVARKLSANRLSLESACRPVVSPTVSMDGARSLPIPRSGSGEMRPRTGLAGSAEPVRIATIERRKARRCKAGAARRCRVRIVAHLEQSGDRV